MSVLLLSATSAFSILSLGTLHLTLVSAAGSALYLLARHQIVCSVVVLNHPSPPSFTQTSICAVLFNFVLQSEKYTCELDSFPPSPLPMRLIPSFVFSHVSSESIVWETVSFVWYIEKSPLVASADRVTWSEPSKSSSTKITKNKFFFILKNLFYSPADISIMFSLIKTSGEREGVRARVRVCVAGS